MKPAEYIREVAKVYASAPSHAGPNTLPDPGTFCIVYAQCEVEARSEYTYESDYNYEAIVKALTAEMAARDLSAPTVVEFNARHTTEEVLDMLEAAAKRVEAS